MVRAVSATLILFGRHHFQQFHHALMLVRHFPAHP
ncbi:hypothetical protein SAMN05444354_13269 [Stigmatella aurantiaca]|uniref:Uncharacterized protein n=1 Tax=Stigmatella aurantiaca TaxID=41 RepID=A0A1H8EBW7_STIAU|nr:hypothetical protein SAMN05444354_13269 [Stigmatella aurantiaca]